MTVFLYSRLYCCLLLLLSSLSGVTAFATVPFNVISMTTSTMTSALTTVTAATTGSSITNGVGTSVASILPSSLSLLLDNEANTNILIATVVGAATSSVEGGNVVEETAAVITTTRQVGLINWDNPAESIGGAITLLYIVFSILAGIKYIVKDGWRPKM